MIAFIAAIALAAIGFLLWNRRRRQTFVRCPYHTDCTLPSKLPISCNAKEAVGGVSCQCRWCLVDLCVKLFVVEHSYMINLATE